MGIPTVGRFRGFRLKPVLKSEQMTDSEKPVISQSSNPDDETEKETLIYDTQGEISENIIVPNMDSGTQSALFINSDCMPLAEKLVIRNYYLAKNFYIQDFQRGFPCTDEGELEVVEFSIQDSKETIYICRLTDGNILETPYPINNIVLTPGVYSIHLKGGVGTAIVFRYYLR